ncbi:hypothetical protein [Streptomyces sp. BBFR102]|uniref:hypothetical protein n=1 Tax=Streptomyces sp. BBFR102 TaxID=3448171 RepID=UPI003F5352EE
MAITDDLRKTLSESRPLYFAAGTADLAVRQARKVPELIEQLRAEAPERIEAVRNTDPKVVQDKAAARAKEAQETVQGKVNEVFAVLDTDLRKLGESAQGLALRSVGVAAEYAVKAKEAYDKVADHGEQAVRTWRGESAEGVVQVAELVDEAADSAVDAARKVEPQSAPAAPAASGKSSTAKGAGTGAAVKRPVAPKKPVAPRKAPARKPAARRDAPTDS